MSISATYGGTTYTGITSVKGIDSSGNTVNISLTETGTTDASSVQSSKSVTIRSASGTIQPDSGYNSVASVSYSVSEEVDANIKSSNIKKDITILGITGTYEGDGSGGSSNTEDEFYMYCSTYPTTFDIYFKTSKANAEGDSVSYRYKRGSNSYSSNLNPSWDSEKGSFKFSVNYSNGTYKASTWTIQIISGAEYITLVISGNPADDTWYSFDKVDDSNYTINSTALSSEPTFGGSSDVIEGTFTPTSSDNVSGGYIKVSTSGRARAFCVRATNEDLTAVDQYAPIAITQVCEDATPANGSASIGGARYKGASSGTKLQTILSSSYSWNDTYKTNDGTTAERLVSVSSDGVYFKTYGNYCFRVGKTYKYTILM